MKKVKRGSYCERMAEPAIKRWLKEKNMVSALAPVSEREDIQGVDIKTRTGVTFQVKHQKIAQRTGNFSFELLERALSDGYEREGNHWHEFELYCLSSNCRDFYIFSPDIIDSVFYQEDDGTYTLDQETAPSGTRFTWNNSRTVDRSAGEWTGGRKWNALNLLVPVKWLAKQPGVDIVRSKVR